MNCINGNWRWQRRTGITSGVIVGSVKRNGSHRMNKANVRNVAAIAWSELRAGNFLMIDGRWLVCQTAPDRNFGDKVPASLMRICNQ